MADLRLRPRFRVDMLSHRSCIIERLRRDADVAEPVRISLFESSAVVRVPAQSEHVWSPQLEVSFEPGDAGGCVLHGLFGPKPSIWTLFIAGYLFFLCAGFVSFVIGMSAYWIGMDSRILLLVPLAFVGMLVVFLVGRFGRRMGRDQMVLLHDYVVSVIESCEADPAAAPDP
ncbi:MAG: hypothetical protein KDD65_08150 [Bacteroidetes bacterium]|nr:hypothetical protein [Bacteroidota bacterium]